MHEILLRAADWWLGTAVGGGLVLLIGCGLMRLTRHPAARQRIGECAVLCALVVASLRLLPAWLPVAWTAKSVTPPSPGFAGEGLGVRAAAPEPSPPTPLPQSRERGEEVASEPAAKTAALPSWTWHDAAAGLMAGYLLIASGLAARWLLGQWALNRLLRQARPAAPRVRRLFKAMAADTLSLLPRLRRRTHLRVARRLRAPVCFGLRRAAVLLPEPMDDAADAQLRWVFADELTHLRRHDPWSSWGLGLAQAIYFFLPWFWWVKRSVRLCQEYVADAAAAQAGTAADEYAEFLVNLARGATPLGATGLGSSSDLLRRVQMLLQSSTRMQGSWPRRRSLLAAGGLLAVAVFAGGVGLRAEPPKEPKDGPEFKTTIIKHAASAYPYIHVFADKEQDGEPPEKKAEKTVIHMTMVIDTGNGSITIPLDGAVADLGKEIEKALKKAHDQLDNAQKLKQRLQATDKALDVLKGELSDEQIRQLQRQIEAVRAQRMEAEVLRWEAEKAAREAREQRGKAKRQEQMGGQGMAGVGVLEFSDRTATISATPFGSRLGVQVLKPSADLADQLDLPKDQGLVVTAVMKDSPAAKAGLKVNDILLELAGKPVSSDAAAFARSLHEMKANDEVSAVIMRKGRKEKVTVKLPEVPIVGTLTFGSGDGNSPFQFDIQGGGYFLLPGGQGTVTFGTPEAKPPAAPTAGEPVLPKRLHDVQLKLNELSQSLGDDHPKVLELKAQIKMLEAALNKKPAGQKSVSVRVENGDFVAEQKEGDLTIRVTGKVKDGKVNVEQIQIGAGDAKTTYKRIDDVPEKHRDAVKKLIAHSLEPLNRSHSPPEEKK